MFSTILAVLSLQLHGWFPYADVHHRLPGISPRATYLYGNIDAYVGRVVPTAVPDHVIMVLKDDRVHGFLHDSKNIRHILWDGPLDLREKILISVEMIRWLHPEKCTTHSVYKYEDEVVLTLAKRYLNMTDNSTSE